MTQKLFYEDTHMIDFTATVVECLPHEKDGQYQIVLDRTAFFPEEGGQCADKGTLHLSSDTLTANSEGLPQPDGAEANVCKTEVPPSQSVLKVMDVQIKNNIIYHIISTHLPIGTIVTGHVDWSQRFDFMQQHSGEHILSGLIHSHYGLDNVGFHLGLTEVTLDMNGELTFEQLRKLEHQANEIIWRNIPIEISYPSSEELAALEYRSKLELSEDVRIVTIPGVDVCACCAPHVESTGQIGILKITNVMRHRGGVRITILCGKRALNDYTEKQDSVSRISALLSAKQPEVANAVVRLQEENLRQKEITNTLQAQLLELTFVSLPSPEETKHAILFVGDLDTVALRNAVNTLTEKYSGYCGIFSGNDEQGYRFIIGSSSLDCRELAGTLRQTFQAKGGGTPPMIQGSIQSMQADIEVFFQNI